MDHEDPFGRLGRWDPGTKQDLRETLAIETPRRIPISQTGFPEIISQLNRLEKQVGEVQRSLQSLLDLLEIKV